MTDTIATEQMLNEVDDLDRDLSPDESVQIKDMIHDVTSRFDKVMDVISPKEPSDDDDRIESLVEGTMLCIDQLSSLVPGMRSYLQTIVSDLRNGLSQNGYGYIFNPDEESQDQDSSTPASPTSEGQ